MSTKKEHKIEKALKYLYGIYPAPSAMEDNTKHNEVIKHVTDIKQEVSTLAKGTQQLLEDDTMVRVQGEVAGLRQEVEGVAKNTKSLMSDNTISELKKSVNEIAENTKIPKEEIEKSIEVAAVQLYEDEKRKMLHCRGKEKSSSDPENFESQLSLEQIQIVVDYMNEMKLFKTVIKKENLIDLLMCMHKEALHTTHNKALAILLDKLSAHKFITSNWQQVVEDKKCFRSKHGNLISSKDLSSAKGQANSLAAEKERQIEECIKALV